HHERGLRAGQLQPRHPDHARRRDVRRRAHRTIYALIDGTRNPALRSKLRRIFRNWKYSSLAGRNPLFFLLHSFGPILVRALAISVSDATLEGACRGASEPPPSRRSSRPPALRSTQTSRRLTPPTSSFSSRSCSSRMAGTAS